MGKGQTREVKVLVSFKEEGVENSMRQRIYDSPRASSAIFLLLRGTVYAHAYLPNGCGYVSVGEPALKGWAKARKLIVFWTARQSPEAADTTYWGRGCACRELGFSSLAYQLSSW